MAMADRLVVMRAGFVEQVGTQEDLYERPATPFVAGFIGRSTMVPGTLEDGCTLAMDGARIHLAGRYAGTGPCTLALRPERISLDGPGAGYLAGHLDGVVELASYLGAVREHLVRVGQDAQNGQRIVVRDLTQGAARLYAPGEPVTLRWDIGGERLFDATDKPLDCFEHKGRLP